MTFEEWWNNKGHRLERKDICGVAFNAGHRAGLERAAKICIKRAGTIGYPVDCGPDDYYSHHALMFMSDELRKEITP